MGPSASASERVPALPHPQRYDDLLDPLQDPDVEVALRRIPAAEVEGRNARLRRALNLSMKKEELPEDMQVGLARWALARD